MTDCSVYIGELDDPKFTWSGGDWNGNVPRSISPDFPPTSQHYNGNFHGWVNAEKIDCKQTDYGGWVAKVNKGQIEDFIAKTFGCGEALPWVQDRLPQLKAFVASLDEKRIYALVATEW